MVTFAVGNWSIVSDVWALQSCPPGYVATSAMDGCLVCSAGKYSLREGVEQECVTCPAGGDCITGGDVVTFAVGGWHVVDDEWVLESCPSGYETGTGSDVCLRCAAGTYSLGQGLETPCMPCPSGGNCLAGGDQISFAIGNWSQVQLGGHMQYHLDSCPSGHVISINMDGCVRCGAGFYSLGVRTSTTSCLPCPAGGNCLAGGDDVLFPLGTWEVFKDTYVLQSCPLGHELTASIGSDECVPCPADFLKLDVGLGKCRVCPAGTTCSGGGQISPRSGFWVDPDVATGKAAEFASGDLLEAHFFVEEGSRRRLVLSGETKAGRVDDVKVISETFCPAGFALLQDDSH